MNSEDKIGRPVSEVNPNIYNFEFATVEEAAEWAEQYWNEKKGIAIKQPESLLDLVNRTREEIKALNIPSYAIKQEVSKKITQPKSNRLLIFERDGKCLRCGTNKNLTIDHIVPLSKGGGKGFSNLQTLCSYCNGEKANSIIDYRTKI